MHSNSQRRGKKSSSWRHGIAAGGAALVSAVGCNALANTTETTLHTFCSSTSSPPGTVPGCADGANPSGQLHFDSNGNLIGTAIFGGKAGGAAGSSGNGVVFKISPNGTYSLLYSFKGGADGANPPEGVIADESGNLYGVTSNGGTQGGEGGAVGNGVVYKLSPSGTETVLYSFCQKQNLPNPGYPNCEDGSAPQGRLVRDQAGNIYSTTQFGGLETGAGAPPPNSNSAQTGQGNGLVFRLSPSGSYRVLHAFSGIANVDGSNPFSGLIADGSGNLFGTTYGGGQPGVSDVGNGVVYELSPSSGAPSGYAYNVLYQFTGYADGAAPIAPLHLDWNGNLFGATAGGGDGYGLGGFGVTFELFPNRRENVSYTFTGGADGGIPDSALLEDCSGNLYGSTTQGGNMNGAICSGNEGCGVVFELSPNGKSYSYKVLYSFTGGADGANPFGKLIADRQGNLYGAAVIGGATGGVAGSIGNGTVFKLSGTGFNASCYR